MMGSHQERMELQHEVRGSTQAGDGRYSICLGIDGREKQREKESENEAREKQNRVRVGEGRVATGRIASDYRERGYGAYP